jgi:hypothetical protein
MPALNWVAFGQAVSWDQANAIAGATGGRLLINDHDPAAGANWPSELADSIDENRYERPSWFGISAVPGGGYRWVNGATVDPAWAAQWWYPGGDPNADANPNNDTQHPVLIGGPSWASLGDLSATDVRQAFIEYVDTKSVHGTIYNDAIFGGGGPGETVRTFGGDDIYRGLGGGKIYLGEGNDQAIIGDLEFTNEWITGPFPTVDGLIFDGPGEDLISDAAAVNAAIDGDDDRFVAHRVSYADDTAGVTIVPFSTFPEPYIYQATGATGTDSLLAVEVVGGSGDDHIEGVPRIQGGAGNDYLAPGINDLSQSPYAEGNGGNDTLVASTDERTELRGGAGDDLLLLSGPAQVSGGAGMDRFEFQEAVPVTIVDLTTQDRIDLSALTDLSPSELFDQGYLELTYAQGYTLLSFDSDGGGDEFELLASLKGSFSQAFIEGVII